MSPFLHVAVRFDIRLVQHVQAVFVGQVVPARIVRIVRGAHGVDVGLLHQLDVLAHALHRHHAVGDRIVFVAVDALDHHAPAIDAHFAVRDLHRAEADAARGGGDQLAVGVAVFEQQAYRFGVSADHGLTFLMTPLQRRLAVRDRWRGPLSTERFRRRSTSRQARPLRRLAPAMSASTARAAVAVALACRAAPSRVIVAQRVFGSA
jgi:hypothetical protein